VADEPTRERSVVVHQAATTTEAMIIRGLLESSGIASPGSTSSEPFPMREPPQGMHGVEIVVLESQAEEARRIIQDYLDDSEIQALDDGSEPSQG
jgi:hypothetical protein